MPRDTYLQRRRLAYMTTCILLALCTALGPRDEIGRDSPRKTNQGRHEEHYKGNRWRLRRCQR